MLGPFRFCSVRQLRRFDCFHQCLFTIKQDSVKFLRQIQKDWEFGIGDQQDTIIKAWYPDPKFSTMLYIN
jgi:hypothetical protein